MSFINTIREDIKTVQAQDPAAQNGLVIFLSYPGLHAKIGRASCRERVSSPV